MPSLQIPLTRGTKTDSDADYRDALPVNAIYTPKPENPFMDMAPGLSQFGVAVGADRGGIYVEADQNFGHFRVSGRQLVSVASDGSVTQLGDISGDDQAILNYSLSNVVVTADRKQWLYNQNDGFRRVTDPDIGEPIDTAWMNAKLYDISFDIATGNTFIVQHEVNQDDVVETLKYSTSDVSPDVSNGIGYLTGNRIAVFNRNTIEIFRDAGGTGFTLQREESRSIDGGLVATHAKCKFLGTWALIGGRAEESLNVHLLSSGSLTPIGTAEVQAILEEYTEEQLQDSRLESRSERGHNMLICHLPRHVLMYDASTRSWCILQTGAEVWRGINGIFDPRTSKWIYGDKLDWRLGVMDRSTFGQYGEGQECVMYTPYNSLERAMIHQLDLRLLPGRYPSDITVKAHLSLSADGLTYGPELPLEIGPGQNFTKLFRWYGLGRIEGYASFRIRIETPYPIAFSDRLILVV